MQYRVLGKTGFEVSEISLGTWQVGGKWGTQFDEKNAEKIINVAIDRGVNFIDTADVYSEGLSEAAVAKVVKSRKDKVRIATKCGRRIQPHISQNYTVDILRKFVEDSLMNMKLETLDLIQIHCPPTEVYYRPEIFGLFEDLKKEGKILNLGVSVEKVEEALKAITYPNVTTVQIIFNMFRQRPAELFFKEAAAGNIGIIVRVPLASGLLTGKFTRDTLFEKDDHRFFNRNGEQFDKGETFSGIPYETGITAVGELRKLFPGYDNLSPVALKWILMHKEVSCIIPGASKPDHIYSNLKAENEPELFEDQLQKINGIYERHIRPHVYYPW
jgi:aryl-alcohol dehydrogenase-like predicted oxidoreductase